VKLAIVLPGLLISLAAAAYFWRVHRFVSIGVLLFIAVDFISIIM
jgi:hypothetical protein